ncbi:hypothetical protein K502DRAFT_345644 [Neoconidiobolus thromboides FSU 785]|nr:hypothetical protein K502DRAFT_345644 [Neoconidiobolus thromboides FSU 785]
MDPNKHEAEPEPIKSLKHLQEVLETLKFSRISTDYVINPKKYGGGKKILTQKEKDISDIFKVTIKKELNWELNEILRGITNCIEDVINCSEIENKNRYIIQKEKFQINSRAVSLNRNVERLLTLTYKMKRGLLLKHSYQLKVPVVEDGDATYKRVEEPEDKKEYPDKAAKEAAKKDFERIRNNNIRKEELARKERDLKREEARIIPSIKNSKVFHPYAARRIRTLHCFFPDYQS